MASLPVIVVASSSPRNLNQSPPKLTSQIPDCDRNHFVSLRIKSKFRDFSPSLQLLPKTHLSVTVSQLLLSFPCLASESMASLSDTDSGRIDLESILVSIDDFFNRYPFFVAGCTFIWLVVLPAVKFYMNKFKPISAINAFRKLKKLPSSQLLDIRDEKNLAVLPSPTLKFLGKSTVQVPYTEQDELGFLEKVKKSFPDQENTVICVLDNFDGNSSKVAQLLINNGFQEAYYIKGGVRGKDGWLAIQEELLPPLAHMYPKTKAKPSQEKEIIDGAESARHVETESKSRFP